jgi:hypothetical protein
MIQFQVVMSSMIVWRPKGEQTMGILFLVLQARFGGLRLASSSPAKYILLLRDITRLNNHYEIDSWYHHKTG